MARVDRMEPKKREKLLKKRVADLVARGRLRRAFELNERLRDEYGTKLHPVLAKRSK